jgi:hypothetical protein
MLVLDQTMIVGFIWAESQFLFAGRLSMQAQALAFLSGLMSGTFGAQLLLAVAYAALGDGSSPRRILYTTFLLAVFTNSLVVMNMLCFRQPWGHAVVIFLIPTLLFFLLQIPVWGIRSFFGITIKSPWFELTDERSMRFSLAHLLGWSAFLAVPLCILQGIVIRGEIDVFLVATSCFFGVVVCVILVWFLHVGLADTRIWKLIAAVSFPLFIAAILSLITTFLWVGIPTIAAIALLTASSSAGAAMLLCLRLAYRNGFRLVRARQ